MQKVVTVTREHGLHARPAAEFVKLANTFESEIELEFNGETVDAKSIMSLMGLGISQNSEVTLIATGVDQEKAIESLQNSFNGSDNLVKKRIVGN